MLVDNGIVVNILPCSMLRKLSNLYNDLARTDVSVCGFSSIATKTKGGLPVKLKVGSKKVVFCFLCGRYYI